MTNVHPFPTQRPADDDDAVWMARLGRGDLDALGTLHARHAAAVARLLVRIEPDLPAEVAEDLAQDTFVTLAETAGRYRDQGNFRAWLFGIATRKLHDWRRRGRYRRLLLGRFWDPERIAPAAEGAASARQELGRALAQLPAEQRDVLVLHELEGVRAEDIAVMCGIHVNTVWTRLHRARTALQGRLEAP